MRLYYIANARMPSEKAHGIQIAKMCEALLEHGVDLTLIVPSRRNSGKSLKDFYGLRREIRTVPLPSFDWYDRGRIGYALSTLSFTLSYFLYMRSKLKRGDVVYTVDLDHLSYALIPFLGAPYFSEMHGGKPNTFIHRILFKNASGIIPTNSITRGQLQKTFGLSQEKCIVEPNGVDFSKFSPMSLEGAREKLGLPKEEKIALYIGRFFDWKGLDILPDATKLLPKEVRVGLVGGSSAEFLRAAGVEPTGLTLYGSKPYGEIPLWTAAASALLVLGTKKDEQSWGYTSPMKVFEYMAMKRPIVASRTPALADILDEDECYFYEPDNAASLKDAILSALESDGSREERAYEKVKRHSWDARAERTLAFMRSHTQRQ